MPSLHAENDSEAPPAPEYCIDAGFVGSFARFINHSYNPNLFVQCVLTNHHDVKLAKVMLFCCRHDTSTSGELISVASQQFLQVKLYSFF
jgi:SET domain-containing protein